METDERWLLTNEQRAERGMGPWTQMDDMAHRLLTDGPTSKPVVHYDGCYICEDPEFAQMGLPLCRKCRACEANNRGTGHIPADDTVCSVCGYDETESLPETRNE